MSLSLILPFLIGFGVLLAFALGIFGLFKAFYRKVDQGTALIVNDMSAQPKVHFTGALIVPVLYKAEEMQISLITLQVDRRGKEGLICRDNIRADISVAFYLRVNETPADVLRVAKAVGAARASDQNSVEQLFNSKFSEALKTVGKRFEFNDLFEQRQQFRDAIVEVIGKDLNGYVLEDVAIDYLEQTRKSDLDPNNIMDAEGIRKITELTARQNIKTNELEQDERLAITRKNTETREHMLEMERQQAEAEAKQKREVTSVQAREEAEARKVIEQQRLMAEQARIEAEEQIKIREQNQMREVQVAEQNRRRAVTIEAERVERAGQLEKVTTDREVQLQQVERDKVVEQGRMDVANVVRERTTIEQTVAVAEEKIKETREVSEADRAKQVAILAAEAAAQEQLVKDVKSAEAAEQAARHRSSEIAMMAEAELVAAGKQAEAKKSLAEGIRAEKAAPGLADAHVKEATASAIEKTGLAEARVLEAKAEATYKQGSANARALAERLEAEASGQAKMGQAKADSTMAMGKAEAESTMAMGKAEAESIGAKMSAEAEGLTSKFDAMGKMSAEARAHEEYRMSLETQLRHALAAIEAGKEISRENADVLAEALKGANIELIGGDGGVFDALTKGVSIGKALEGIASHSPLLQQVVGKLAGLPAPAKETDPA
ncbi:hypothetical protein H9L17_02535 [Thermomonas brevis]|uniref:Flotillin family protein n=1 Tax=Thermomonas brevis TaxID=215691 RepID=A0A7G9QUN9_9GAMM|nr:hypothetical protein [Thermomonas brevis]QNN47064.1 hypothetical protein H9L17_02535 [Thermomonas brevis]